MFTANEFVFDGISCKSYGLVLVKSIDSASQSDTDFQVSSIVEDRISKRYSPVHYGTIQNKPLVFTLVCATDPCSAIELDRWDFERISSWLTGHQSYKWLSICQPDMEHVHYKCIITSLSPISIAGYARGFQCTVTCDSPFAYMFPIEYEYTPTPSAQAASAVTQLFINRSSYNGVYKPKIQITTGNGTTSFKIINTSDGNRTLEFSTLPASTTITIDNENEIITDDTNGLNLYQYFTGYKFFRALRGDNQLKIIGDCTVKIICEFPVSVGG